MKANKPQTYMDRLQKDAAYLANTLQGFEDLTPFEYGSMLAIFEQAGLDAGSIKQLKNQLNKLTAIIEEHE